MSAKSVVRSIGVLTLCSHALASSRELLQRGRDSDRDRDERDVRDERDDDRRPDDDDDDLPRIELPSAYCPKGWVEYTNGEDCLKYFDEKLPFGGMNSAAYACNNWNLAYLVNEGEFEWDSDLEPFILEKVVPSKDTNWWLDTRDYLFQNLEITQAGKEPALLGYVCKIWKTNSETSIIGRADKCTCDAAHLGEYCGPVNKAEYCCVSKECKPRRGSNELYIPGQPCGQDSKCDRSCELRGLREGQRAYCTEDCPCFAGEGPCQDDSECYGSCDKRGVCTEGFQRSDFPPQAFCASHAECGAGMYCDTRRGCWPCTKDGAISRHTCDAVDGDCCSNEFLAVCPSNPAQCGASKPGSASPSAPLPPAPSNDGKGKDKDNNKGKDKGKAPGEVMEEVKEVRLPKCAIFKAKKLKFEASKCGKVNKIKLGVAMQGKQGKCKAVKACPGDEKHSAFSGKVQYLYKNKKACQKARAACEP